MTNWSDETVEKVEQAINRARVRLNRFFAALEPAIKEIYGSKLNEHGALDFIRARHYHMHFPKT